MFFDPPLLPNNVQYYPRPPTYDLPSLPPSARASFWLLPISLLIQHVALAIIGPLPKGSPTRKILPTIVVPIIIGIGIQAALFSHHLTSPVINFGYGTAAVSITLQGIDLLLIIPYRYDAPLTEILKITGKPCPGLQATWRQRFDWAGGCYNNPRMLLTPFEPEVLKSRREKVASISRTSFLVTRTARVLLIMLIIDCLTAWCRYDLWFGSVTHHLALPDTLLSGALRTLFGGFVIALVVDGEHAICAVIMVGIFGNDHAEWPDMFGIWTEEWYTIADFWGIAWHGLFRQQFVFLTYSVKNPVVRLAVPFLLSATLHFVGAYMQARDGIEAAMFLMLQPAGILIQQMIVGKNLREKSWVVKGLTFVSTIIWLLATAYGFITTYARTGMFDIEPIPFSFLSLFGLAEGPFYRYDGAMSHLGWY